jgi:hypothetical protein
MTAPVWRKSSWTTGGTSAECVEVAELSSADSTEENPR